MPAGGRPLLSQRRAGCCGVRSRSRCDHVRRGPGGKSGAGLMSARCWPDEERRQHASRDAPRCTLYTRLVRAIYILIAVL